MKYNISFDLNKSEKIIFLLDRPLKNIHPCEDYSVIFVSNKNEYKLSDDCLQYSIQILCTFLCNVISNKLILHESIDKDIGYISNEDSRNAPDIFLKKNSDNIDTWVGLDYLLYSTPGNAQPLLDTWLYNTTDHQIIFKITPCYPWHDRSPQKDEKYVSYEKFMKNYRPILTRVIPKKVAQEWLEKAQHLLKTIEDNYHNLINENCM